MEHTNQTREQGIEKLRELMKDVKFCMLTTITADGSLRSRPMTLQQSETDGDLWFFMEEHSPLADEIEQNPKVNVSFANGDSFVSVSGKACMRDDPSKKKQLWQPAYKMWFPQGLDDPDLVLLKIDAESAEYWDTPGTNVVYLFGMLKTLVTGKPPESITEHETLKLGNA